MPFGYKQMQGSFGEKRWVGGWAVLRRDWIIWELGIWELERCIWDIAWGNVFYLSNSTIEYDNQCVSHTRIYLIITVKHEKTKKQKAKYASCTNFKY